jgi:hypothetical protein
VQQRLAFADLGGDLRRILVNADGLQIERRPLGVMHGIAGGVGPVRHAVGAHAAGEFHRVAPRLPKFGLGRRARLVDAREQVAARGLRRLEPGTAAFELAATTSDLSNPPPGSGWGNVCTPWERMQWEKASAPFPCADAVEALEDEVLLLVAVEPSCAT